MTMLRKFCKDCGLDERAPGRSRCYPCYYIHRKRKAAPAKPGMRVLLIDIETTPNVVLAWDSQLRHGGIGIHQIQQPTRMLCFAAKWLDEPDSLFFSEWEHGRQIMVAAAHQLLDEADVVVHYNGKRFDTPHINREMKEQGMFPPSPFKQVDLYRAASKMFKLPSHKLQYVSTWLGEEGKIGTDFGLWTGVMSGDREAQRKMEEYNIQDTQLLEDVYYDLLPWIPSLPNRNLYEDGAGCPACGSHGIRRKGYAYTHTSKYNQYQCTSCGLWMREGKRVSGVDMRGVAL